MVVTRSDLEGFLAELEEGCRDPRAGLFGPGSWMWKLSRESILFLGGGRAALLQLAHPYVATAVKHHSASERDLPGRFQRTFLNVFSMVFGDLESALGSARRVHELHATIHGPLEETLGPFPKGHRYDANEEEALLWVYATLTETSVMLWERFFRPMTDLEKETFYQDSRSFARLFGIPDSVLPRTWDAFVGYFDSVLASNILTVGEASRRLSGFLFTPPNKAIAPAWKWYKVMTAGLLPARVRDDLGLPFGRSEKVLYTASLATLRATWRRLPPRLRWLPAYVDARRRLQGHTSRDRFGEVAERVVMAALRQEPAT